VSRLSASRSSIFIGQRQRFDSTHLTVWRSPTYAPSRALPLPVQPNRNPDPCETSERDLCRLARKRPAKRGNRQRALCCCRTDGKGTRTKPSSRRGEGAPQCIAPLRESTENEREREEERKRKVGRSKRTRKGGRASGLVVPGVAPSLCVETTSRFSLRHKKECAKRGRTERKARTRRTAPSCRAR
jgi:hypothetical protein